MAPIQKTRSLAAAPNTGLETISASVDYPQQNEVITSPEYTVRVAAPEGARSVAVCIDQGDWLPCREAVGYWWFDWAGYGNGEHSIVARVETADGGKALSKDVEFFVAPKA